MITSKKWLTFAIVMSITAMSLGVWFANQYHRDDKRSYYGTVLQSPRDVPAFSLTGTDGKAFTQHQLKGQWTLLFFGFTQCGYLCPTTMNTLAAMFRALEKQGVTPLPHVVMLSLDGAHDTKKILGQYVTQFDPHFYGARGESQEVERLTQAFGIAYQTVANTNQIEHSGAIIALNPAGQLVAFFTTPHDANHLAEDYRRLIS